MEQSELLRYVVEVLEGIGISYFVTGSVATIYYGEPRLTNDIDIVVRMSAEHVAAFCRAFPSPDYYLSVEAIRQAVETHTQFHIIHPASGLQVDVIIADDTPFNRSRFTRASLVQFSPDYEATFASIEDVFIKKMEYYRQGGSEKNLRDIAGVIKVSGDRLDRDHITHWVSQLGLDAIWETVQERAGE
jgi:hypothetical protein